MQIVPLGVLVAGNNGYVNLRSGGAWLPTPITVGPPENLFSINSNGNIILAGSANGTIYASTDGGLNYSVYLSGLPYSINGVRANSTLSRSFVCGGNGLILRHK